MITMIILGGTGPTNLYELPPALCNLGIVLGNAVWRWLSANKQLQVYAHARAGYNAAHAESASPKTQS